jgi:predicted flap endonuclease-1-like 5' DNA nuclease
MGDKMSGDHSVRTLFAATFLTAALLVAMNYIVQASATLDWWLPLVLFILGLALALSNWYESRRMAQQATTSAQAASNQSAVRVWDDLTRIEGIGPRMADALVAAGIDSYDNLASASESQLRAALKNAGLRLAPSVPTWPEQAAYAARGDWDGLSAYQKMLLAGRKA